MKSVKSQGHIEMIISFGLFIGALAFIFVFINPLSRTNENISYSGNVERMLMKNITITVGKLSIIINSTKNCYFFKKKDFKDLNYVIVNDLQNTGRFFAYFSDFFDSDGEEAGDPECRKKEDYIISSYSEENILAYEKLQELKNNYENNYEILKKELGINREFSFSATDLDGDAIDEISVERKSFSSIERDSKFILSRAINKNGEIMELVINIIVW